MNWITPTTGLFFAAITVPVLLILYFLRLRRQTLKVPSTMLWQQSIEDLHANTPFQRLRPSALLLLQLLALILVILAIMQPQIKGAAPKAGNHVVLIDTSSSMLTKDYDGKTRLDVAKEQAVELVTTLHGGGLFAGDGGKTMVIAFSDNAIVVSPFSDSKQQLVNAIESIEPTHGSSEVSEALTLARAYTTNTNPEEAGLSASESAQLELFSDGRIEGLSDSALQRGETIVYHSIGSADTANVGVYNLSVSRLNESSDEIQTFLSLVNSGSEKVITDVTLFVEGVATNVTQVEIQPSYIDEKATPTNVVFMPFALPNGGVVSVKISGEDAYQIHNEASVIVSPPQTLSVLYAEQDMPIIQTVLEGMPLQSLKKIPVEDIEQELQDVSRTIDVVVLRDVTVNELPNGRYLIFGQPPPVSAFDTFVEGQAQEMLVAREEHPVMRFVRYEEVFVSEGFNVVTDDTSQTLLEGSKWPAVLYSRTPTHEVVYVAFDPLMSNWPYLRSFPFFVYNTLHFLGRNGNSLTEKMMDVGDSLSMSVPANTTEVQIKKPAGVTETFPVLTQGTFNWGPFVESGVYTISFDQQQRHLNVAHPNGESFIQTVETIHIGTTAVDSSGTSRQSFIPLWPWALGAVLIVLVVEWCVYQRKVGGARKKTAMFEGMQ